ncbi:MAG: sigma factor-like helix-turn-helix DNA-binding protein [Planctomycetota bacterium]
MIVEAVESLREPYREVVLRRFLLDHPPRRIAADLGRPVKTVKSQIARGTVLLREKLEGRVDRDGRSLLGAITVWCVRAEGRPVPGSPP